MSKRTLHRLISLTAFAAGLAAVALAVGGWRIEPGSGKLGLDLRMIASNSGELSVRPAGAFVTATGLAPGRVASGHTTLRNETGAGLVVRARALPDSRGVDRELWVELYGDGTRLYRGPLGGLRRWSRGGAGLAAGKRLKLAVRAWVPAGAHERYRGAIVDVPLELGARRAGATG
ncbi:MAG TPA: hypothetical protein VF545_07135 [Thermoleophilaceae bacterium]